MKFTIDKTQGAVSVDGVTRSDISIGTLPTGEGYVRWFGEFGEVDYILSGSPSILRKRRIVEFSAYQTILDLHAAPAVVVPTVVAIASISPRQIRQALTRAGLRTAVEAAVSAGDKDLKDWYEFSTAFERMNPQVVAMGFALGVSSSALDDLWTMGATL